MFLKFITTVFEVTRVATRSRPIFIDNKWREKVSSKLFSSSTRRWNDANQSATNKLQELLRARFPNASAIHVEDISGGCGDMYEIWVESDEFKNVSRVKQHKMITETLKKEIKEMHGLRITTTVPERS